MSQFPELYTVAGNRLDKLTPAEYDGDPRGIVWMWEPPEHRHTYVIGCDPANGRTGWNRYNRVKEDTKTDNGVIEVIRVGKNGVKDAQVCEYAAPVDAFDL